MHAGINLYRYKYTYISLCFASSEQRYAEPTSVYTTIEPQRPNSTFTSSVCLHKHLVREFTLLLYRLLDTS